MCVYIVLYSPYYLYTVLSTVNMQPVFLAYNFNVALY